MAAPTLVMAGQYDVVPLEHTVLIADSVTEAQLCIVPGGTHLMVMDRSELVGRIVRDFLDGCAR